MPTYCFRAEAGCDIDNLFTALDLAGIACEKLAFDEDDVTTGGECNISAAADLETVLDCARQVVDGHVIVRTLRPGRFEDHDMDDVRNG
ncbi:Uncharacterised protein (plasmid) [Tsukamurella tyrosinosolvens]|uniref:Uncharacterized protein n=1 Tax=Tsukamurella tyrosinosolvens TaxID=57704 RepID=A0A1H4U9S4_TSUTY|nr:hypothetical protein [Tsukamurella tyrosinosolvens]KXO92992.1 hypothetical protein AXK58_14070 [Tsukamurella tyrosinosolvens]SEC65198.1 hypothetical protein SAMN04489793_2819 [Tsukamurella tyrosinosolvens]VEH94067.1 Uncharacterised protein [Tsukamurella tyrosinosolvens]